MKKLKEILKQLNIDIPKVISTNCKNISDSLPEGWCHHNVFTVQQKHGGQTVLGFVVVETDHFYWLVPHSIWKAGEIEYYDVTTKDKKEIFFIPIKTYDSSIMQWILKTEIKIHKQEKLGIDLETARTLSKNFTHEEFRNFDLTKLLFIRNYPLTESDSWEDYQDEQTDQGVQ